MRDLTGLTFNDLTVLRWTPPDHYLCRCRCGTEIVVGRRYLLSDHRHSCGCKHNPNYRGPGTRKLYLLWKTLMRRVESREAFYAAHKRPCPELIFPAWQEYPSFAEWALSQGYVDGMTIQSVPKGKSYSPPNIIWSRTGKTSRDRTPASWVINGVSLDLRKLASDSGIPYPTLLMRLKYGWSLLDAITRPLDKRGRKPKST